MSKDGSALRVVDLHKSFDKLEVLRGIDLEVDEHEVVCLIGASGSGKVDPASLHEPPGADRSRADRHRR
jgi:ABC-type histidine transport system ATPase subunit